MTCCGFGFYLALVGFVSWHLPSSIYHLLSVDGHVNLHHYHWDLICDRSFFVSPFLELAPEFSNANIFSWPFRLEPNHCIDFWDGPLKLPLFAQIPVVSCCNNTITLFSVNFGISHSRLGWGFANLDLSPTCCFIFITRKTGSLIWVRWTWDKKQHVWKIILTMYYLPHARSAYYPRNVYWLQIRSKVRTETQTIWLWSNICQEVLLLCCFVAMTLCL